VGDAIGVRELRRRRVGERPHPALPRKRGRVLLGIFSHGGARRHAGCLPHEGAGLGVGVFGRTLLQSNDRNTDSVDIVPVTSSPATTRIELR